MATTAQFAVTGDEDQRADRLAREVSDALEEYAEIGSKLRYGGYVYRPRQFDPVRVVDRTQQADGFPSVNVELEAPFPTLSFLKAFEAVLEKQGVEFDRIAVMDASAR